MYRAHKLPFMHTSEQGLQSQRSRYLTVQVIRRLTANFYISISLKKVLNFKQFFADLQILQIQFILFLSRQVCTSIKYGFKYSKSTLQIIKFLLVGCNRQLQTSFYGNASKKFNKVHHNFLQCTCSFFMKTSAQSMCLNHLCLLTSSDPHCNKKRTIRLL